MEILFLWVGLLFFAMGVLIIHSFFATGEDARRFDGEIIGYAEQRDSDGDRTYAPVIVFRHPRAGRLVFKHPLGTSTLPARIGQKVRLLVTADEPMRARLDTSGLLWFGAIFAIFGGGFAVLFFAIYEWSLFSVVISAVVTIAFALSVWWKRTAMPDLSRLTSFVREATTGSVVDEREFDRRSLIASPDLAVLLRKQPRQALITAIVCLAIAAGTITWSYYWVQKRFAFLARAHTAGGVVVDMAESSGSDCTTWAPIVEYTPDRSWNAAPVRFKHPISSSSPSWSVGDRVRVLYDPELVESAMIDSGFWNRATPFIPAAIGALMALLGFLALRGFVQGRRETI
jgi:hypothetical protein